VSSDLWLTVHCALPAAVSATAAPRVRAEWDVASLRFCCVDAINLHRLKASVRYPRPAEVAHKRHQHVAIRVLVDVGGVARRLDIGLAAAKVGEMALAEPIELVALYAGFACMDVSQDHLRHFFEAAVGAVGDFRRGLMAARLGIPADQENPSYVLLNDGAKSFDLVRSTLQSGGLGYIDLLWNGQTPGMTPVQVTQGTNPSPIDLSNPDGRNFSLATATIAAALAASSSGA
jgi:hypothetical protein